MCSYCIVENKNILCAIFILLGEPIESEPCVIGLWDVTLGALIAQISLF